jgi:hypothetical protein
MLFALAHARPLRMHEPGPLRGRAPAKSKIMGLCGSGGGCGSFAACSFHPFPRLTGYYALRGFCYTPLAECRVNEWGIAGVIERLAERRPASYWLGWAYRSPFGWQPIALSGSGF